MSKILWIIVIIIVLVALYNTFAKLSANVKFESLSGLFRIPSGLYHSTSSTVVSVSVGGDTYGGAVQPSRSSPVPPSVGTQPTVVPPTGFTTGQLSPYYGQVKISSVSAGNFPNSNQFSLSANSLSAPLDITGWRLKSNNRDIMIPKAVSNYDPSGFSLASDIVMGNNQRVSFYNATSPILVNLRLNECTGYLNNAYNFTPTLPNNCPSSYDQSEIISFSGSCQDMILSLWGCSEPTKGQLSSDQSCRTFLTDRFNYSGCYKYHRGDANFLSNEWSIWLNGSMYFDNHDLLLLFDREGLLVDRYSS